MLNLLKYSTDIIQTIKPTPLEGLLYEFWNFNITKGAYLTLNVFNDNITAQKYLAITFKPKWEMIFHTHNFQGLGLIEKFTKNWMKGTENKRRKSIRWYDTN